MSIRALANQEILTRMTRRGVSILRNPWDAEDVTQYAWLWALKHESSKADRSPEELEGWLWAVFYFECRNYRRRRRIVARDHNENHESPINNETPENAFADWQFRSVKLLEFQRRYRALDETERTVFVAAYVQRIALPVIAKKLGLSIFEARCAKESASRQLQVEVGLKKRSSDDLLRRIQSDYQTGLYTYAQLARKYDKSLKTISLIVNKPATS